MKKSDTTRFIDDSAFGKVEKPKSNKNTYRFKLIKKNKKTK
jgi:hypothetical protein